MNRLLIAWLVVLALSCAVVPAFAETRLFTLQHRRGEDVAAVVQAALGSEARVVPIDHGLLVTAAAGELALAVELLDRLDQPARMLRVYVNQSQSGSARDVAVGGAVRIEGGDALVVITGHPPRSGATVVVDGEQGAAVIGARAGSREESYRAEQFLTTLDGSPALISVGRRIPFSERWLVLARHHAHWVESTRYESVDTGFAVTPTLVADNQVELAIHPYLAFADPQRSRDIRFSELTTRVRIPLNVWFDLAGTMGSQDEVSREILGVGTSGETSAGGVRVKVELQPE